ncbi:unnamed protein product [Urochloa humidicola]
MDDAKREEIRAILKANAAEMRRTARERMTYLANRCECARKYTSLKPPPLDMLGYPDLFERAWGWDMILLLLRDPTDPWSQYKEYLLAYYDHNLNEINAVGGADDEGNGLLGSFLLATFCPI